MTWMSSNAQAVTGGRGKCRGRSGESCGRFVQVAA